MSCKHVGIPMFVKRWKILNAETGAELFYSAVLMDWVPFSGAYSQYPCCPQFRWVKDPRSSDQARDQALKDCPPREQKPP